MPAIGISVTGVDAACAELDALEMRIRSATRKATGDGLTMLRRRAVGRLSRYYHPRGTPTPSPVGEPPARIDGRLKGSLKPTGPVPTGTGYAGSLGPTEVYSRIQELGGQAGPGHSVTIPPRPYLRPTVRDSREAIHRTYFEAWQRAM